MSKTPKKDTPEYEGWIKTPEYEIWKNKCEFGNKNKDKSFYKDPEWIRKQKEACIKNSKDPEWIHKHKEAIQNPEWLRKNKEILIKRNKEMAQDPEWRLKVKEGLIGGFWYGSVQYYEKSKYCELWNKDLWKRIDAFWDYKSSLYGLTKEDNGNRALSRHHVYWQPKACCEWDEDKQGYYAWINIGTNWKPNWYKHYVNGDPNKFVLLTSKEHGMVSKDKLKWIKIFEDIIEQRDGKSYYTKEEMEKLNIL